VPHLIVEGALVAIPAVAAAALPITRDELSCLAETGVIAGLLWAGAAGLGKVLAVGAHGVALAVVVYALCRMWSPELPGSLRSHLVPTTAMAVGALAAPVDTAFITASVTFNLVYAGWLSVKRPAWGRALALLWLLCAAVTLGST
jgi:hypothetical protein